MKLFSHKVSKFDRQIFVFGTIFTLLLMVEPIVLISIYETPRMLVPFLKYITLCFVLGVAFVYVIMNFLPRIYVMMVAIILSFILFSLKLSFYSAVTSLGEGIVLILFVLLIYLTRKALLKLKKKEISIHWKAYALTALITLISPMQLLATEVLSGTASINGKENIPIFKDKPNIYLLSYDSLSPSGRINALLDIPELPYEALFEEDFHVLNAGMSFHVPTRPSINNIMRLGQKSGPIDVNSYAGNSSSFLQRIAHANGYHMVNGYRGLYFGSAGPFVDESLIPDYGVIEYSVLCIAQPGVAKIQAFGICRIARSLNKRDSKFLYKLIFSSDENDEIGDFHDQLMTTINGNLANEKPVFTFVYTYNPIGHTSAAYDHDNLDHRSKYRNYYLKGSRKLVKQLPAILETIKREDSNALVMVFGDHGAFLSRQVDPKVDPEFYYNDRNGIMLAVAKTDHPCSGRFASYREDTYNTPSRVLAEIFNCLSNGEFVLEDTSFDEDPEIAKHILMN